MMKRIVTLALALVLTLAFIPMLAATPAIANDEAPEIIQFAGRDWRILDVDTANSRKLIITENIIEQRRYHSQNDVTWENSEMREYLNDEFLDSFNETDRARILETTVINNDNPWFGTAGGNNTQDHIFLLSLDEVVRYFGDSGLLADQSHPSNEWWGFNDQYNENRIARLNNGTASWWWLRSPGNSLSRAARVNGGGVVYVDGGPVSDVGGIRPALWLAPCDCEFPSDWTVRTPATCTDEGLEYRACIRNCGEEETHNIAALGHEWGDWTTVTAPTATAAGEERRTCGRADCNEAETRPIPAIGINQGIDYTPWQANNHLIVSSTSTDTATINLTTETIDLAGFVPTQFSINGGQRWRNVRADGTTFTTRFATLLNREMTLHIRDGSEEGATIITFPQINRRPRAPRVQINFLKDHDPSGQTPGYWLLTDRPRRGTEPTVQRDASIQLAVPALNARQRPTNLADTQGWGQFFNGEGDRGIPVLPLPESNRVTRTRYLVRLAPTQETDNTFTPASRTGRVNVSSERRPTRLRVNENRGTLTVRANTFVSIGDTTTLHTARTVIDASEVTGRIYVWQAAALNGRRPASARQVIAR